MLITAIRKEMSSEHEHLILYCEVWWFPEGMFCRLFALREGVLMFLNQHTTMNTDVTLEIIDNFSDVS